MHDVSFLRDLAIVMLVAGATTVIFHRLRQPVLLGYILAGVLIGPNVPGPMVSDPRTINGIANLGVVLLMFTLGLEFSVGKLRRVGAGVMAVAVAEVAGMLWLGYEFARLLGWAGRDALFLGAAMGLSSTMIASRMLSEHGLRRAPFAQKVVALLVAEDVLSVVLITLLTAIAVSGSVAPDAVLQVLGRISLFVIVALVLGLLLLPRLVDYIAGFGRDEMLLVAVLGICFGASLLASWFGFSVALGAFIAGAVVAESRSVARISHLVEPLRDMFAALFFVAIGLLIEPQLLWQYALPALGLAAVLMLGKTLLCGLGIFLAGDRPRDALRTGLSMAQIGEFSFVIATIGLSLKATGPSVYPVIVAVSVVCMALAPHGLRHADGLANVIGRLLPRSWRTLMAGYGGWLEQLGPVSGNAARAAIFRRLIWHIGVNVALVVALFVAGAYVNIHQYGLFLHFGIGGDLRHTLIWAAALFLSLPMLIAVYRKAEALGMVLAELGISEDFAGTYTHTVRAVLARLIPLGVLLALALLISALSSTILPPRGVALALVAVGLVTALILWRALVRLHASFQSAIKETVERDGD
ncbi:MAG TPA: cation:proton antiporter [Rhodanobacteraceae bacterium]|nr:cation:proton antiporter [Rhodanobacteraceae bacterium]